MALLKYAGHGLAGLFAGALAVIAAAGGPRRNHTMQASIAALPKGGERK